MPALKTPLLRQQQGLLGELLETDRLRGRHQALAPEAVDASDLLSALVDETFGDGGIKLDLAPPGIWLCVGASAV